MSFYAFLSFEINATRMQDALGDWQRQRRAKRDRLSNFPDLAVTDIVYNDTDRILFCCHLNLNQILTSFIVSELLVYIFEVQGGLSLLVCHLVRALRSQG